MEALEDFCLLRAQSVQGQLEGAIPSTDEGQSEDSSTLVDASSVDISAMGTMNNGGGQRSWERGMGQSQEAVEGAGMSVATQDSASQAPAIPQGQEDMGSPPELPSGEGPQEAPGQTAPDSASSATEENPASEAESSSGEGDTPNGEESASAPAETGGAMGQEPPTQPAEGTADAGIEAQPGALGQGQSQASSATEQWVLLGGPFWRWGWGWRRRGSTAGKGNHPGHGTSPGWNACRSQACARRSPPRDVKLKKDMARGARAMSFCWMRKPDEGSLAVVMQRQRSDGSSSGCWRPGREQLSLRGRWCHRRGR